ncbi:hypothetical protein L873DRAFT_1871735 [Choiromyces venosus 120613-1]|uniref:Clr5 domain-containing protein n=1 Tax=Choiromyces venosus 120613-1 TaxID=1336337 RepID=A0A3N4J441_9PEZI|nr:hypothetical protein L873DRAFT_1871735 [Choiromyces venosus 120613-1]
MPKVYDWELYKEKLADLYLIQNANLTTIIVQMEESYKFKPSLRAYRNKFSESGFTKDQLSLHKDQALVTKVKDLWARNMSSANILRCLSLDSWQISAGQLRNLQLHTTLRCLMSTAPTPEVQLEAAQKAEIYVREHLISGQAIRYGCQYTLSNIRLSGVFVSQKQVWEAMKVIDPEGVASRAEAFGTQRKRKEFTVKGPNWVLSIDGHDKLSRFGFEIYGAIDAYSWYIA